MKTLNITLFLILGCWHLSCQSSTSQSPNSSHEGNYHNLPAFQNIIDSAGVKGCILVYDLQNNQYFSNDYDWANKGQLPASTFKIPNSLIALETGVAASDSTLFKWDGQPKFLKSWEQDLILRDAFRLSCVPCYQDIARKVGVTRMQTYVDQLQYGHMDIDSSNINLFWLTGKSRISPMEQISFLKKLYENNLPISKRSLDMVDSMMVIEGHHNGTLFGKTGWSSNDSVDNGWFVGYQISNAEVLFFAANVEPKPTFNMDDFAQIRKDIVFNALELFRD
ncbi:class D beta-lactamase [Membranihabitans marinus]|uniref:class D beta-lactamase n=1 Tax=Membranihabitans marinus TaxID=1227546 RepID=UPI001EFEF799|nr:class D beta-lactamase [Membranihabitans marinus]